MKLKTIAVSIFLLAGGYLGMAEFADSHEVKPFAPNVNMKTGAISVPENYTHWATLGTWAHANTKGDPGSKEYHIVYTQPETIDYYRKIWTLSGWGGTG